MEVEADMRNNNSGGDGNNNNGARKLVVYHQNMFNPMCLAFVLVWLLVVSTLSYFAIGWLWSLIRRLYFRMDRV
jgi:hypothetical protein